LRRQLNRDFRKPLILMTPKSLLRHKRAVSRLDEMGPNTTFHRLLWDDAQMLPDEKIKLVADDKIRRVVICTGKVYYDLYDEREKRGLDDVYLLRIEQLYPFPTKALMIELTRFKDAEIVWCQEEPRNMGIRRYFPRMGAQPDRSENPPGALRRPAGFSLDRGRADVDSPQPAQTASGRRAGIIEIVMPCAGEASGNRRPLL